MAPAGQQPGSPDLVRLFGKVLRHNSQPDPQTEAQPLADLDSKQQAAQLPQAAVGMHACGNSATATCAGCRQTQPLSSFSLWAGHQAGGPAARCDVCVMRLLVLDRAAQLATSTSQTTAQTTSVESLREAAEALGALKTWGSEPAVVRSQPTSGLVPLRSLAPHISPQSRKRASAAISSQLPANLKLCSSCREVKPHSAYHCCKAKRDGLQDRCKVCRAELDRRRLEMARQNSALQQQQQKAASGAAPPPKASVATASSAGAFRRSHSSPQALKRGRGGSPKVQPTALSRCSISPQASAQPPPPFLAHADMAEPSAKRRRYAEWGAAPDANASSSLSAAAGASTSVAGATAAAVPRQRRSAQVRRASAPAKHLQQLAHVLQRQMLAPPAPQQALPQQQVPQPAAPRGPTPFAAATDRPWSEVQSGRLVALAAAAAASGSSMSNISDFARQLATPMLAAYMAAHAQRNNLLLQRRLLLRAQAAAAQFAMAAPFSAAPPALQPQTSAPAIVRPTARRQSLLQGCPCPTPDFVKAVAAAHGSFAACNNPLQTLGGGAFAACAV